MKTYIIEGGIGKTVCFTALDFKEPYQVYTPYPHVFINNSTV